MRKGRLDKKTELKMPITQATLLMIYGQLNDLLSEAERAVNNVQEQHSKHGPRAAGLAAIVELKALRRAADNAQRTAVGHMLADDPSIEINPLTGEIED